MRRNLLLRLLAENRSAPRRVQAAHSSDDTTTIYLYDFISADDFWGGVTAKAMAGILAMVETPKITLRIDSPGGDVFPAKSIAQLLKEHPAEVTAVVDGMAASAATLIALAADKVRMAPGSFFMIHRSWSLIAGNKNDMLLAADLLDKVDDSIVQEYVRATGGDAEQIVAWMDAETWFSAEEAVANGFAQEVIEPEDKKEPKARWKLGAYSNAPSIAAAPEPETPALLKPTWADAERRAKLIQKLAR